MHFIDEIRSRRPKGDICHYTSLAGFLGILRTRSIWASKIQYLNDEQDFRYSAEITKQYLDQLKPQLPAEEQVFVEKLSQRVWIVRNLNVYVASFSENDDQLSQWRGYCPPGKGINIGFHASDFDIPLSRQPFHLLPCIYDGREQARIIRDLISQFLDEFRAAPQTGGDHLLGRFALFFTTVAPILKHEKFAEEAEWRLVSNVLASPDPRIRHRDGLSMIIPYYDFQFAHEDETLQVSHIRVGPTPHPELAMSAVSDALDGNNVKWRGVGRSFVPYRSW
jgi:hypothetical protein